MEKSKELNIKVKPNPDGSLDIDIKTDDEDAPKTESKQGGRQRLFD